MSEELKACMKRQWRSAVFSDDVVLVVVFTLRRVGVVGEKTDHSVKARIRVKCKKIIIILKKLLFGVNRCVRPQRLWLSPESQLCDWTGLDSASLGVQ